MTEFTFDGTYPTFRAFLDSIHPADTLKTLRIRRRVDDGLWHERLREVERLEVPQVLPWMTPLFTAVNCSRVHTHGQTRKSLPMTKAFLLASDGADPIQDGDPCWHCTRGKILLFSLTCHPETFMECSQCGWGDIGDTDLCYCDLCDGMVHAKEFNGSICDPCQEYVDRQARASKIPFISSFRAVTLAFRSESNHSSHDS